jgi:C-terminal processing protease CtpA/Prc
MIKIITLSTILLLTIEILNAQTNKQLTNTEKLYGLSTLWKEASYNFAHFEFVPELDWNQTYQEYIPKVLATKTNEEYQLVLKQFYALLKQHHTFFFTPQELEGYYDEPKIEIININNQPVVANISEEYKKDIPIGSIITKVDELEVDEYIEKYKFPYISYSRTEMLLEQAIIKLLRGKKSTELRIIFQTPKGKTKEAKLTRNKSGNTYNWVRSTSNDIFDFKWLNNDFAYVALRTFADRNVTKQFQEKVPELLKSKGIIIDLRKNGGGDSENGYDILKYFVDNPIPTYYWESRENIPLYRAWGRWRSERSEEEIRNMSDEDKRYILHYKDEAFFKGKVDSIYPVIDLKERIKVPVVILTGNNGSAAEDFLISAQHLNQVTLVGKTTAGCTGTPYIFDVPTGGIAFVTTTVQYDVDGQTLNRDGVKPDYEIHPTIEDVVNGNDAVLGKGIEILNGSIK